MTAPWRRALADAWRAGPWRRALGAALHGAPRDLLRQRAQDEPPPPLHALHAGRQVVFDLETTGLVPSRGDAIVAIGAVAIEAGRLADRFQTLVHPGRPIRAQATRYHGITDADVASAPPVSEALADFRGFVGQATLLVAHNAAFDRTALHMAEVSAGAPGLAVPILCSLLASRWLDPALEDHDLDAACLRNGVARPIKRHDALSDAEATAALWQRLLDRASRRGITSPAELARRAGMARAMLEQIDRF